MGAMFGTVLANPLTAMRDFAERALPAARPQSTPCSPTGRLRANALAFALSLEHRQVPMRAKNDP